MEKSDYDRELKELQTGLVMMQRWIKRHGTRVVIVFEGRDTSGKGGVIKAITDKVSPRVFRVAALPAPTEREKSQLYMQRYMSYMPAAGEVVLFDRSWYNRALVEPVMGFCEPKDTDRFLRVAPEFERYLVSSGITVVKYWLEVSSKEQKQRLNSRIDNPIKQWKLSELDLASRGRWYEYSRARDRMFAETDTDFCPWYILPSDSKYKARLNCIRHLLELVPYEDIEYPETELPKRDKSDAYDDAVSLEGRRFVPEFF